MKHRLFLIFVTSLLVTFPPKSHGLSFLSLKTRHQTYHGYTHRSRLFGVSNPQADDNNGDSNYNLMMPEKKSQPKPDGDATSASAKAKVKLEQKAVLKPHAPKTSHPPNIDTTHDEDESTLKRLRDLLDTQSQVASLRSPT